MNTVFRKIFLVVFITFSVVFSAVSQTVKKGEKSEPKKDSIDLKYKFTRNQEGGLFLNTLAEKTIVFDKQLNSFVIVEKIGDYETKTPIFMTPEEYKKYRLKRDMLEYFKEKVSATNSKKKGAKKSQRDLLPSYYVNSKFFETVFGGNKIDFVTSGNLNLKLGFIYQNVENPQLTEDNRSSFTFDFDQQINASLQAKIGTRLNFNLNYDTQSTFDFQNLVKIEFIPPSLSDIEYSEDGILQGLEVGNTSMSVKNSLINGAQSLLGVKAKLKFGKTSVTTVFSQQRSESKTVTAEAGATIQPFELRATDYDTDRHFFLSHFFRDNYANSLKNYPLVSSQTNITRIEIWVTNRNSSTEDFRSIVAFADLGESNTENIVDRNNRVLDNSITQAKVLLGNLPFNEANKIGTRILASTGVRNISTVDQELLTYQMKPGTDYSFLQNARKLQPNEYKLNSQLGFISLSRRLNDGEVLAVAYEYTIAGNVSGSTKTSFKVGEFSNDGIDAPENLAVKLLRSEILTTKRKNTAGVEESFPTWRLMMKNVYALGAFPLSQDGFRFEIQYRDDQTGIPSNTLQNAKTNQISNQPLLQVLKLDQLDQSQSQNADGFFDYVEGVTVNSERGYVIFPEPEPFGEGLDKKLTDGTDKTKYLFNELYLNTKINIKNNYQNKDKFFLKGSFKSKNSGGIPIGAFNVPRGSVKVTAGGRQLLEGVDYVVDYLAGKVQIIDPGLQASGTPINVSTENNSVFNQQQKTFMGIDVEHEFSEDFIVGATLLNVEERPLTPKVNFGSEPINNTMFGMNIDFSSEVPALTKLANKLPFVDTDAPSNLSLRADIAYMLPGTPSGIDVAGAATSYIDDFEASQVPLSLLSPLQWFTTSTPRNDDNDAFNGGKNDLSYNHKRARLAWYTIDQLFYGAGDTPQNINADELSRAETRQVSFTELFPKQENDVTQINLVRTLDLAYFPTERGSYNYNEKSDEVKIDPEGSVTMLKPTENFGGVMRALTTNNFDQANVEYIQFWIQDPYKNYSITNAEGLPVGMNPKDASNQVGDLYINLGNISEDILKDNRKMYENGIPAEDLGGNNTEATRWGKVPKNQSIIYAFDEVDSTRVIQDVGFDGLNDTEEKALTGIGQYANLADPAGDNFTYFRGGALDTANASIISRYKNFNRTDGNSPTINQSPEAFPTSSTTYPDVEDINRDQTMSTIESYYEYKISMNQRDLKKGQNFIVDEKNIEVTLQNGGKQTATWYQFRMPIRSGTPINGITDFNSIRFVRMYLTNFKMPVVLRFGELDLVRGDWRRYVRTLDPKTNPVRDLDQNELNGFEVGVVSLEQNQGRYVLPPGIEREQLQGSTTVQQQNEQSVSLKVTNLEPNKTRAIYKNISIDLRRFKQLKMFMHLENLPQRTDLKENELSAVIRLGTDLNDNFYQLEIPLKVSEGGLGRLDVWPEANNLDAMLELFGKAKLERDTNEKAINEIYTSTGLLEEGQNYTISVKGNPTLSQIRTVMLGVKNVSTISKSGEVWFNELRAADFDNDGGWAAVMNLDANLADVADVSLSGRVQTVGFGNVEDRVGQRSLDDTKEYDVTTSINLGKVLTPEKWGIQLPMNFSVGETIIEPKFDPQYQDVKLEDILQRNPEKAELSRDYTKRTSISFTNVKKNRNPSSSKKPRFYDVENLAVSYAHNKKFHRDYNIQKYIDESVSASASYNFTMQPKFISPFKNVKLFNSKYLKFIKDINFNPFPKTLAFNSKVNRSYNEQQSRNLVPGLSAQPELKQRRFLFDWDYTIGFDVTKSLQFNFNATNSHIYDTFGGNENLEIFDDFFNTGRANHYHQKLNGTYKIPIDKFPFLDFIKADYTYTVDFDWQAAPQSTINVNGIDVASVDLIGNVIQNSNTHNLNANFSFEKLYKNIGIDRWLKTKRLPLPLKLHPTKKDTITNKPIYLKQEYERVNYRKGKVPMVKKVIRGLYNVASSVKQGKISYAENNGQLLPGYVEDIGFLGGSPTAFAFGSQVDIRNKALTNGWLVTRNNDEEYYNKTYSRTHYNKLDYTFSLKPIKDLTISVRGNKIQTRDLTQQLDVITGNSQFEETPFYEQGNFSSSHLMISTAFTSGDVLFQRMRDSRVALSSRLASENGIDVTNPNNINTDGTIKGFGRTSQQVLLPAFMAAYSGNDPKTVNTGLFRDIPIPNWNLRYNGFMKMKFIKKNFRSFVVSHGYRSSYTVSGFTNNLQHKAGQNIVNTKSTNFEPELLTSAITLVDEFSPLIKVDLKLKNSFSFRGEIKSDRTLTMNFNNSTLTDIQGTEFIVGMGYVFKDVKFSTRFTGTKQTLKGDINLRADISMRDNLTQIRSVDEDNNQVSGGQKLFSLKLSADYRLSSSLTASFYYNHQSFENAISTTFPRQSINGGINIIYNLGN